MKRSSNILTGSDCLPLTRLKKIHLENSKAETVGLSHTLQVVKTDKKYSKFEYDGAPETHRQSTQKYNEVFHKPSRCRYSWGGCPAEGQVLVCRLYWKIHP